MLTVNHADIAVIDGDIDVTFGGRNHAGRANACDNLIIGDIIVFDQARWNLRPRRV